MTWKPNLIFQWFWDIWPELANDDIIRSIYWDRFLDILSVDNDTYTLPSDIIIAASTNTMGEVVARDIDTARGVVLSVLPKLLSTQTKEVA